MLVSCNEDAKGVPQNAIARVGNDYLTKEQLLRQMPEDLSSEDSIAFTEQFIQKWIKEEIIVQKAEEVLPEENKDVTERLEEYRKSLLIYAYEQAYLVNRLDISVTEREIAGYYESHKEDFLLKGFIIKGYYGIFKDSIDVEPVKEWYLLKNTPKDYISLFGFSEINAVDYHLDTLNWMYFDEIMDKIPLENNIHKNSFIKHKRKIYFEEGGFIYFLNVLDYKLEDELSPLEFEKDKIKAIIINKRTKKIRTELAENLYNDALKSKDVEVFEKNLLINKKTKE